jgi:hypothetical protein
MNACMHACSVMATHEQLIHISYLHARNVEARLW